MANNIQLQGTIKEAITLAFPIIIANSAWTLLSVADTAFVGRLGTDPLAAIGIISSLDFLFAIVLFALGSSSQITISRFQGGGQTSRIPHVFWNSILMLVLTGLLLSVIAFIIVEIVLPYWISSTGVLSAIKNYMKIKVFSYPLIGVYAGLRSLLFGNAITYPFGIIAVIISILNIILDYVLIFGFNVIPPLGMMGAALASVLAITFGTMLLAGLVFYKRNTLFIDRFSRLSPMILKKLLDIGFPLVAQGITAIIGWFVFFLLVEKMGSEALAVTSAGTSLLQMMGIVTWALTPVTQTVISNLLGQGKHLQVIHSTLKIASFSLLVMVVLVIIFNIFPELFWKIYTDNSDIIQKGLQLALPISTIMLIFSISTIFFNALAGTGKTTFTWLSEIIAVLLYVSYAWLTIFVINASITIVWFSESVYWLTLAIMTGYFLFIRKVWTNEKNHKPKE